MQYFIINEFESKNIILIVEHRQMNILFNAFSVCMIRQLLVTTIPRYNSICSGTIVKFTILPSSLSTLKVLLGLSTPGASGLSET